MINVTVKTYGDEESPFGSTLELETGSTLRQALRTMGRLELAETEPSRAVILVNQKNARLEDELKDGDRILILISMAGG